MARRRSSLAAISACRAGYSIPIHSSGGGSLRRISSISSSSSSSMSSIGSRSPSVTSFSGENAAAAPSSPSPFSPPQASRRSPSGISRRLSASAQTILRTALNDPQRAESALDHAPHAAAAAPSAAAAAGHKVADASPTTGPDLGVLRNGNSTGMAQSDAFTQGLLKTALHLIDEKAQMLKQVENMLLPLLDSLLSGGGGRNADLRMHTQLVDAHKWALSMFATGNVSFPGASRYDVRLCGWLGKLGRAGTKMQRRWCELSGQTLTYFADGNGLELRGQLDLEGCTCRPLPPGRGNGEFCFELAAAPGRTIHKVSMRSTRSSSQKRSYRFSLANEEELSMWTVAIQEAINQPELRRVKEMCKYFRTITDGGTGGGDVRDRYAAGLSRLPRVSAQQPLIFPCDWLHQEVSTPPLSPRRPLDTRTRSTPLLGIVNLTHARAFHPFQQPSLPGSQAHGQVQRQGGGWAYDRQP